VRGLAARELPELAARELPELAARVTLLPECELCA